jgi:hypothetical protein
MCRQLGQKDKGLKKVQGKMKGLGKVALFLTAVSLTGCAMAPGMTMTEPAEVPDGQVVRVTPITLDLVNEMDAAHDAQRPCST